MQASQVSPAGAVLFMFSSILYLAAFFIVHFKIFNRRGNKAESFCEQAQQDGRMVLAYRDDYRMVDGDGNRREYIGKYSYTAPDGRKYNLRYKDRCFNSTPPETITLYLEKWNYRKYHTRQSLTMGKHGNFYFLLSLAAGFLLYLAMMKFIIMPVIFK